ncbi:MAG: hypothetical protein PHY12_02090 [Eubacteriales bacterium]|nr:hypothetical protein [Eubacteriales bacterium]
MPNKMGECGGRTKTGKIGITEKGEKFSENARQCAANGLPDSLGGCVGSGTAALCAAMQWAGQARESTFPHRPAPAAKPAAKFHFFPSGLLLFSQNPDILTPVGSDPALWGISAVGRTKYPKCIPSRTNLIST